MPNHGGSRPGAGGTITTITISLEHARALRTLLKARPGSAYGRDAVARWVEQQIEQAQTELDAQIEEAQAQAWEGEVL